MEIALMNRQEVAELDQSASGVAGTGQHYGMDVGIVEHEMVGDIGKFSRQDGYTASIPHERAPEEFLIPKSSAEIFGNSHVSAPVYSPVIQEKTTKKNRIVMGMGVLSPPQTPVAGVGSVKALCRGSGAHRDRSPQPGDLGTDPCESPGNLIFSCYERQERIYTRINQKIERLEQKLTKLEGRRMQNRDEMRKSA